MDATFALALLAALAFTAAAAVSFRDRARGMLRLDPGGDHLAQLFRIGFALGADFSFVADTGALARSGVPEHVLRQHPEQLAIRLPDGPTGPGADA